MCSKQAAFFKASSTFSIPTFQKYLLHFLLDVKRYAQFLFVDEVASCIVPVRSMGDVVSLLERRIAVMTISFSWAVIFPEHRQQFALVKSQFRKVVWNYRMKYIKVIINIV